MQKQKIKDNFYLDGAWTMLSRTSSRQHKQKSSLNIPKYLILFNLPQSYYLSIHPLLCAGKIKVASCKTMFCSAPTSYLFDSLIRRVIAKPIYKFVMGMGSAVPFFSACAV
jgi:hypothetical protein